jgi:hypothetical protein
LPDRFELSKREPACPPVEFQDFDHGRRNVRGICEVEHEGKTPS